MGKIKLVLLALLSVGALGYACKKDPVDSKLFVEHYLTGSDFNRWPIQSYVKLEFKNLDTLVKDTIDLAVDTAIFSSNKQFIRGTEIVNFNVDEAGENITFTTQPDSTWKIDYVRPSTFKLVHERKETIGADVITYKIEQIFKK